MSVVGRWWAVAAVLVASLGLTSPGRAEQVLDSFETLDGWTVNHSDNAFVELALDEGRVGRAMRIDFDIQPGGSFVIIRKAFAIDLPKNYAFRFWLRGAAPPNDFQLKLIDKRDQNVWWYNQRNFNFPDVWRHVLVKDPRMQYAWGPAGSGPPRDIGFVEIAISAGSGGRGSLWIDHLTLEKRAVNGDRLPKPKVEASTSTPGNEPHNVLHGNGEPVWRSGSLVAEQWLQIDFQRPREYGGLVIVWDRLDYATAYRVLESNDGKDWSVLYESTRGNGGRDYIYTPDAESRFLRLELLRSSRGQGYSIRSILVKPYEMVASPNQFFEAMAQDAPLGTYPRYFSGQQTYWTSIGDPQGGRQALLSDDGALEPFTGSFSIEPFLFVQGKLLGWNDVRTVQELEQGYLPIPSVTWEHEQVRLGVTVVAGGRDRARAFFVRYRLHNPSDQPLDATLFLALRPFQVLPFWQNLNLVGGVTNVRDLVFDARTVWVNGKPALVSQTPPDQFGASTFEEGSVTEGLASGRVPLRLQVSDPFNYASGALEYRRQLEPHASTDVYIALPGRQEDVSALQLATNGASAEFQAQLDTAIQHWSTVLNRVEIQVPPEGATLTRALRTSLAHILIHRDGPSLQPGPRTYARAWIRDGASMSAALLQMGFIVEPREFIRWYAQFVGADGRVACCVDRRGPDPVPEHDSNGELLYTLAEYYRYTRDIGTVSDLWPAAVRAAEWIRTARQRRMTSEYQQGPKRVFYGLLPESISHEGYSSRPVHSYWDGFWGWRGLKDAASLAAAAGDDAQAAAFAELRDAFGADLIASIERVIETQRLEYIPASVELADFDPNSTAIALSPVGALRALPETPLRNTFDRYFAILQERLRGDKEWDAYTPYELRNVPAFLQLGQRERAWAVLEAILRDQRPLAWQQWPEILWRNPKLPRFVGDMPHAWIGAIFIEAVRSLFAYEQEADAALVLAAGIPATWVADNEGVGVRRLPTHYGVLSYTLRSAGSNALWMRISGDLTLPPGGIVLKPPTLQPIKAVQVNGHPVTTFQGDRAVIHELPAEVVLEY